LNYLERNGEDTSLLLQSTTLPEEFLKDPSYWMPAQDMEKFLEIAAQMPTQKQEENLLQKIGHQTPDLRSWGVLDSVLRMMPSPQEILAKPSRFLSYFISPEPPVDNILRTDCSLQLDLPVPSDQFPYVTEYLKAGFESLPVFMGKGLSSCTWQGMRLSFDWQAKQNVMFDTEETGRQLSPELLRSIVSQLEKHQLELQQKNAELEARNQQLKNAYENLEKELKSSRTLDDVVQNPIQNYDFIDEGSLAVLKNQFSRLGDYMVRAQQLVAVLTSMNKQNSAAKEAMKRIDWDYVQKNFPLTMGTCIEIIQKTEQRNKDPEKLNRTIEKN